MKTNLPTSVDDLRRFLEIERTAQGRDRMGKRTLAVLDDMLARPGTAAVQSISELAAHNGVEPSTLTRLGKRLGFSGFGPLQDLFRRHVAETQPFYSNRVDELLSRQEDSGATNSLQLVAQSECQKVMAVANTLNQKRVDEAVNRLIKARRVYVLASRGAYGIGHFFGTYLATLTESVSIVGEPGLLLASALARIQPSDLLVAISFRPYTRSVVKAVEFVKSEGVPILSLTDAGSAIEVGAGEGTTIAIDQPFYFDSAMAQYFVAEALLVAIARKLGPKALTAIRRREAINKVLDIEIG
ncbi:MurR/RpiR family transcriptional regulator [Bradyrhizobium sp. Arg816]|uniref:MurR/RpiR family transcriptional regulator n=1 Tax=Bradyrhizobium sp. Arg816 TaxID=2998491 RepID=UPI00249F68DC|nr:MurR/RpiR family transcriptional regulator [Bradyrhizobium sp. Arg816]MDI3567467.1 MurR/RpiR family transcriptional regulator [Bradyrhizobium sp. Arg816]